MSIYPLWYYLARLYTIHWVGIEHRYYIIQMPDKTFIPVYPVSGALLPGVKYNVKQSEKIGGREWLVLCQAELGDRHLRILKWLSAHEKVMLSYTLPSIAKINLIYLFLFVAKNAQLLSGGGKK